MINVSFVIPCYRESTEVVAETVAELEKFCVEGSIGEYEILVVDDGNTGMDFTQFSRGAVRVLSHRSNRGYGASLKTGIRNASHEWIGILDADGTYPIASFKKLVPWTESVDMVIGSRSWSSIEPLRRPAKKFLTAMAGFVAARKIPDLNSGMRLFRRELYEMRSSIFPDQFSFSSTLTMVGLTQGYETHFESIEYHKRIGKSSIHPIRDPLRFLTQILRLSLYFRPLRFFIPVSSVFLGLALARGIRDVLVPGHIGGLALVLFFLGFQVFFFGLIAEIINKK
tara:strand:- start:15349 stop:16197 length:849 start_codon:yes stop_codon:yes gene_type:complete